MQGQGGFMKCFIVVIALTVLTLTSCEQLPGATNEAKREVRKHLIDPSSGQFESVYENPKTGAVCGFVNAKNRMGAYVGASPFVYEKLSGATLVQEQPTERDFERFFETIKYAEPNDYTELENRCKSVSLWQEKCGTEIHSNTNKYCQLIDQGKSEMDIYEAAKPNLDLY
ncbi:hypothetical protein UU5_20365 [Rhodanobacter sp. 115]|nr:hypothetical protein UU5_20365 [Rhodanobacter sp. 115]